MTRLSLLLVFLSACQPQGAEDGRTLTDKSQVTLKNPSTATSTNLAQEQGTAITQPASLPTTADPLVSNVTTDLTTDLVTDSTSDSHDTESTTQTTFYEDADSDRYGNPNSFTTAAASSLDGYVTNSTDCDDTNNLINPGATEICGDGIDNDCDGSGDPNALYQDSDDDGYGDPYGQVLAATATNCLLKGWVGNEKDCNDDDPNINPETKWYQDSDEDGLGDSEGAIIYTQCDDPSSSTVTYAPNNSDEDDNAADETEDTLAPPLFDANAYFTICIDPDGIDTNNETEYTDLCFHASGKALDSDYSTLNGQNTNSNGYRPVFHGGHEDYNEERANGLFKIQRADDPNFYTICLPSEGKSSVDTDSEDLCLYALGGAITANDSIIDGENTEHQGYRPVFHNGHSDNKSSPKANFSFELADDPNFYTICIHPDGIDTDTTDTDDLCLHALGGAIGFETFSDDSSSTHNGYRPTFHNGIEYNAERSNGRFQMRTGSFD